MNEPRGGVHHLTLVKTKPHSFFRQHSLSIVSCLILVGWIVLYSFSDPGTHWGSFYGNAIADWTGMVVTVLGTKFLYEIGSAESRTPPTQMSSRIRTILTQHSLTIFLAITGVGWIVLFARSNPGSKWGQVVGNIVSEWTQVFGLVILTKKLIETHSKDSNR